MNRKKTGLVYLEILLVIAGHFFYSNYIKTTDVVIRSDGKGYYDYLPALFIYHDLNFGFRQQPMELMEANVAHDVTCNGKTINKYPCGLALLWTPFFAFTHEYLEGSHLVEHNGYSLPYHFAVYIAALAYLLAGLIYLRKLLFLYTTNKWVVRLVQLAILLGTNLYIFTYFESAFGHVYSFALITMFAYGYVQWYQTGQRKYLFGIAVLLALITLIRPFNILVLLFLPFLTGGFKPFWNFVQQVWQQQRLKLIWAALVFFAIVMIQPVIWYTQCGRFLPWTYAQERFYFLNPTLWQTLFSFKKGLFIYTPVLLLSLFVFPVLFQQKKKAVLLSLFVGLFLLHYFISSWQTWWYGGGFGLRPYIDFYAFFAIMMVMVLSHVRVLFKWMAAVFILACTVLNLIQTYQYTHFILFGEDMDYTTYKQVFLKTGPRYETYLDYRRFAQGHETLPVTESVVMNPTEKQLDAGEWRGFSTDSCKFENGQFYTMDIEASLPNIQEANQDLVLWISVTDTLNQPSHYEQRKLFHFTTGKNEKQTIHYYFDFAAGPVAQRVYFGFTKLDQPVKVGLVKLKKLKK